MKVGNHSAGDAGDAGDAGAHSPAQSLAVTAPPVARSSARMVSHDGRCSPRDSRESVEIVRPVVRDSAEMVVSAVLSHSASVMPIA